MAKRSKVVSSLMDDEDLRVIRPRFYKQKEQYEEEKGLPQFQQQSRVTAKRSNQDYLKGLFAEPLNMHPKNFKYKADARFRPHFEHRHNERARKANEIKK